MRAQGRESIKRAAYEEKRDRYRAIGVQVFDNTEDGVWSAVQECFWAQNPETVRNIFETKHQVMKLIILNKGRNDFKLPHFR